ncbi:hypothetical protein CFOL_v3_13409 [Cephalotus follicularis]|uniref:GRIP domain-containing protein n=1 Tax=Cephalotus follicularis TaxID=3775 RepID=A0A1Q3BPU9_CEPFO|nr:hypothetical protein CFOL_v3_13409 [Cephalotus follicularis]
MWGTIANLKENLNKIALDVHDDDDEIYGSRNGDDSSVSDRRNSHRFAHSKPVSPSPVANGIDSPLHNPEIEHYKAEIKKLEESQAQIKALAVNYAAILKEKEGQISRLNQENGSLKQNLDARNAALNASRNESFKASTNGVLKGSGDLSTNRQNKVTTQVKNRYSGNQMHNGVASRLDNIDNGITHAEGNEKELADLLEEKNRSLAAAQASHEMQTKQFRMELEKERDKSANLLLKLQEERKLNHSVQDELQSFKMEKDKTLLEMSKLCKQLDEKMSEIKRLEVELNRRENKDADDIVGSLKRSVATLEKENSNLKMEKNKLEAALEMGRKSATFKAASEASEIRNNYPSNLNGMEDVSGSFPGKEEMDLLLEKLEKDLKEAQHGRDKALQELARLKQHLLEKEFEESEKMDEDSKIIEELRENNEYQRAQVLHLEKALNQAIASQEKVKIINDNELQKCKQIIDDLNKKLSNCMSTIDAKNVELLNLQTALGQYYAEIEAKEHLERDLAVTREESAKLSVLLKDAEKQADALKREKEEIMSKLSQAERTQAEGKNRVKKFEEDNMKLRRALEQSMTRLNRMSVDSDFLVDRRIVIKLLVTYFQRNHSKEVLDLMVRMLGFSDEDKQRIGVAQHGAGKGVVRGVLGLPGRLVGGFLGGSTTDAHGNMVSDNQSFADLWVDYLLKETERREAVQVTDRSNEDLQGRSPIAAGSSRPQASSDRTSPGNTVFGFTRSNLSANQNFNPLPLNGNIRPFELSDSEFSTIPFTLSESNSRISRLPP